MKHTVLWWRVARRGPQRRGGGGSWEDGLRIPQFEVDSSLTPRGLDASPRDPIDSLLNKRRAMQPSLVPPPLPPPSGPSPQTFSLGFSLSCTWTCDISIRQTCHAALQNPYSPRREPTAPATCSLARPAVARPSGPSVIGFVSVPPTCSALTNRAHPRRPTTCIPCCARQEDLNPWQKF
jgi:hypothetical protein